MRKRIYYENATYHVISRATTGNILNMSPKPSSRFRAAIFIGIFLLSGCASYIKKSLDFNERIAQVKTIAVLPPDIEVYSLTAGGVKELIDEWTDASKALVRDALKKHFGERLGFQIKFIEEPWLKAEHKEPWEANRALYDAVSLATLIHAYPGVNAFPDKLVNYDYTLGKDVKALADACGADALLFVRGVDHEATAGRTALLVWNILMSAATGVTIIPTNPSFMSIALVDAQTGDVEWFITGPPENEYSFRSKEHIDGLIEWLTRDFLKKK